MKQILLGMVCLAAIPAMSFAQTSDTPVNVEPAKQNNTPKIIIGLNGGVEQSKWLSPYGGRKMSFSGGLFARYYMGEHLALETGFQSIESSSYKGTYNYAGRDFDWKNNYHEINIPLQLQYHLLKKENPIRPYFGAGVVVENTFMNSRTTETGGQSQEYRDNNNWDMGIMFSQGLTWQVGRRLQINQSLNYKPGRGNERGVFGIRLGVGYTIK